MFLLKLNLFVQAICSIKWYFTWYSKVLKIPCPNVYMSEENNTIETISTYFLLMANTETFQPCP